MTSFIISQIINDVYDEVYTTSSVKKLIGSIVMELKRDVIVGCNHKELEHVLWKGLSVQNINPHQVCLGTSAYIIQYHLKEGYNLESSKYLGCKMWNDVNNCNYFPDIKIQLKTNNIENNDNKIDDDDELLNNNILLLERMCRIHHKRCDLQKIRFMTYQCGKHIISPYTFWMCYDKAVKRLKATKYITKTDINKALLRWNEKNVNLFTFKESKKLS